MIFIYLFFIESENGNLYSKFGPFHSRDHKAKIRTLIIYFYNIRLNNTIKKK
jgi:hypothetical protein